MIYKYKIFSQSKKKIFKKVKVSVITVVYNGEDTIEKTIKNVLNQTYKNVEFILVYTPSSDRTFDIIKKYKSLIDKVVINTGDIGIYQSMNIGIKLASGKYTNFMNSGDYFFNKNTISRTIYTNTSEDVLYGDVKVLYPNFSRKIKALRESEIKNKMFFSHQSCFVKTELYKKYMFDLKYYYSSDYDFFYKLFKKKKLFKYTKTILSICKAYGIVDREKYITLYQNLIISNKHRKKYIREEIKDLILIIFYFFLEKVKRLLPRRILLFLTKLLYKKI